MKIAHTEVLAAPREKVYAALSDPLLLKACIEGCETLDAEGPDTFRAVLKIGFGTYRGRVEIRDRVPLAALTLAIEGKGLLGRMESTARLRLSEKDGGTEIVADGDFNVGGMLAALGPGMIETAGRKLLADFFRKFAAQL